MTEAKATNELRTLAHRLRCKDSPAHVDYISKDAAADWADRLADQYAALYAALRGLYELCPEGHRNDERGKWADARNALLLAEGGAA